MRPPTLLLLLASGVLAGPVLGRLDPDRMFGGLLHPFVSLADAVAVYEGGLTLELRALESFACAIIRHCTVGALVTWLLATALGILVAGLTVPVALVPGAIPTVTGPTATGPLLRQVRPRSQVEPVARWEGIVADLIGADLAALTLQTVVGVKSRLQGAALPGAEPLAHSAFVVIMVTVAFYGLAAGPLARKLGLSDPDAYGVLFGSAGRFIIQFASVLKRQGVPVVLVDTNRASVAEARLEGLTAYRRSILADELFEHVPLTGIGKLLALTPNDEVNALACMRFAPTFGRAQVYQGAATDPRSRTHLPQDLRGRVAFRGGKSIGTLDSEVRRGATVKATPLTATFDLKAFLAQHGAQTVLLGRLVQCKRLELYTEDREPEAQPNDMLLSLVLPPPPPAPRA